MVKKSTSNTNRFLTPDTIVPDPANPQSLNRFSYVLNNPLKFTDPSGHCAFDANGNQDTKNDAACWQAYDKALGILGNDFSFLENWQIAALQDLLFWLDAGVNIENSGNGLWDSTNLSTVISGLNNVKAVISDISVIDQILGLGGGGLSLIMCPNCDSTDNNHHYSTNNSITFDDAQPITTLEFIHELGHAVDWNVGSGGWFSNDWWSNQMLIGNGWSTSTVTRGCWVFFTCSSTVMVQDLSYAPPNPISFSTSPQEDFADTFAGYVLGNVGAYPSGWNPMPSTRTNALTVEFTP